MEQLEPDFLAAVKLASMKPSVRSILMNPRVNPRLNPRLNPRVNPRMNP